MRSSRGGGNRCEWQLRERGGCRCGLRQKPPSGGGVDWNAVSGVVGYARGVGKPLVIQRLDFRPAGWRESPWYFGGCPASAMAKAMSRGYREGASGQPGVQFRRGPGEVHGAIRADGTPGAALVLARRYLGCDIVDGFVRSAMVSRSPSPYPEEASEARVDVLGSDNGAAETGASQHPEIPSGSGGRGW